jgi:hypothetical protein
VSNDGTRHTVLFPNLLRRPAAAKFDQRRGSSDGGERTRVQDIVSGDDALRAEDVAGAVL